MSEQVKGVWVLDQLEREAARNGLPSVMQACRSAKRLAANMAAMVDALKHVKGTYNPAELACVDEAPWSDAFEQSAIYGQAFIRVLDGAASVVLVNAMRDEAPAVESASEAPPSFDVARAWAAVVDLSHE